MLTLILNRFRTALLDLRFWSKVTTTLIAQFVAVTSYAPIDAVSLFDKVLLHEVGRTKISECILDC